jgi:hypothetical protein
MDYDSIRRGLLTAMGWSDLYLASDTDHHHDEGELIGRAPSGFFESAPDFFHRAEDAEALEAWLVGQGWEVWHTRATTWVSDHGPKNLDGVRVQATEEPSSTLRRRRALVLAAWRAVTATREVRDGQDS